MVWKALECVGQGQEWKASSSMHAPVLPSIAQVACCLGSARAWLLPLPEMPLLPAGLLFLPQVLYIRGVFFGEHVLPSTANHLMETQSPSFLPLV